MDHGGPKRSGSGSEKTLLNKIFVGYDPVSGRYKIDWNAATPVNCGTDYFYLRAKENLSMTNQIVGSMYELYRSMIGRRAAVAVQINATKGPP